MDGRQKYPSFFVKNAEKVMTFRCTRTEILANVLTNSFFCDMIVQTVTLGIQAYIRKV